MQFIRGLTNVPSTIKASVVTIGNFDGVHLGHQQLIIQTIEAAQRLQAASVLMTFDPQPMEYLFKHDPKVPRLMRTRGKFLALQIFQLDYFLCVRFNQWLSQLSARQFAEQVLRDTLHAKMVVIGEDFRFGHRREGDVERLRGLGKEMGFEVVVVPMLSHDEQRISSTLIRQALSRGDLEQVNQLLGRPYVMCGKVGYGNQLGRQYGVPTANLNLHRQLSPISGIFAVHVLDVEARPLPAVAYVGFRPTLNEVKVLLEVHIFDFDGHIYGRNVRVEFLKQLREDKKFDDLEQMIAQIKKDVEQAREFFIDVQGI